MFEDSLIESGGRLKTKRGWTSIIFVHATGHDRRGHDPDSVDLYGSPAQRNNDVHACGASSAATASTASSGPGQGREGDTDRHRERRNCAPRPRFPRSSDDPRGRGSSAGDGFDRRRGWRSGRSTRWIDGRRNRQRAERYPCSGPEDCHAAARACIVGRAVRPPGS